MKRFECNKQVKEQELSFMITTGMKVEDWSRHDNTYFTCFFRQVTYMFMLAVRYKTIALCNVENVLRVSYETRFSSTVI